MTAAEQPLTIQVASIEPRSRANGPGERFVVWVQGCPFRCPGCFNPEFQPREGGIAVDVRLLAEAIAAVPGVEGVTYSGGEPMEQARGLWHLGTILRERGLTVVCYTGFTLGELQARPDPWVGRMLRSVDLLIDGRYDESLRAHLPWRGSANQRVHFLSKAYRHLAPGVDRPGGEAEFIVGREGVVATGILGEEFLARLVRELKEGERECSVPTV